MCTLKILQYYELRLSSVQDPERVRVCIIYYNSHGSEINTHELFANTRTTHVNRLYGSNRPRPDPTLPSPRGRVYTHKERVFQ